MRVGVWVVSAILSTIMASRAGAVLPMVGQAKKSSGLYPVGTGAPIDGISDG